MKTIRNILVLALSLAMSAHVLGQVPEGFNYQAILRDAQSEVIGNTNITVRFGIIADSPTGTLIWEEEHSSVTNNLGLFTLLIGQGTKTGGSLPLFTDISWASTSLFLKVSVKIGTAWSYFDPSPISSVPYSLSAQTATDDNDRDPGNEKISSISLSGTILNINENGSVKTVNLAALKDGTGTDDQQLSLTGDNLQLEDGGSVNLSAYRDNPFTMNSDTVALLNGSLSIGSASPLKSKLSVVSQDDLSEDALFEVRRSDGQTVFAVFNEGVQINIPVDPLVKGPRGGFAIGGFDSNKGIVDQFMIVNSDSTRIYIDDSALKGPRGGFAIGGYDRAKTYRQDYIYIAPDSTRIYVENLSKGPRGGFAIGGFDGAKGDVYNFLDLTPDNYFIGHESGSSNTTGQFNTFFGYQAGKFNTEGKWNLFIGTESGIKNTTGYMNTFVGPYTGNSNINGYANVFIGSSAGVTNESGSFNTFLGSDAGLRNFNGWENVFIGPSAGYSNTGGGLNVFIGSFAGHENTSGSNNVFMGWRAGHNYTTGQDNVFIGTEAGFGSTIGTSNGGYNVFLGYFAGHVNTTGDSNVMLGNKSGEKNSSGNGNTFLGAGSGLTNTTGLNNVFVGVNGGEGFTTGNNNVVLGAHGGSHVTTTGDNNIFIGAYAGQMEASSGRLYIEPSNANKDNALIYGEFDNDILRINGKLEVSRNIELAAGGDRYIYQPDATRSIFIGGHSSVVSTYALHFVTAGATGFGAARMSIVGSTGFVGIGTTNPQYRFDVQTSNSVGYVQNIYNSGNSGTSHGIRMVAGSNTTSGSYLVRFHRPDGTQIGAISQNTSTSVFYGTTSDERLKENIVPTRFGLNELLNIRVVDFNFKNDPVIKKETGFIAQQLFNEYPVAVTVPALEDDPWMVDYSSLTPLLVKAVQEQNETIESLRQELIKARKENESILERMATLEAVILQK